MACNLGGGAAVQRVHRLRRGAGADAVRRADPLRERDALLIAEIWIDERRAVVWVVANTRLVSSAAVDVGANAGGWSAANGPSLGTHLLHT